MIEGMRRGGLAVVVSMLTLTQCLLDTSGTAPTNDGGGATGGVDAPSCVPECMPSTECMISRCINGTCQESPTPSNTICGENDEGRCDAGSCRSPRGSVCFEDDECLSRQCTDGFCCAVSCNGRCQRCDVSGEEGECLPTSSGDPDVIILEGEAVDACMPMVLCDGLEQCAPGEVSWAWSAGQANKNAVVTAVAAAPNGTSWAALYFFDDTTVDGNEYDGTSWDTLLVKLSSTGNVLHVVQLGGTGDELVTKLATDDEGNLFVSGQFSLELEVPGDPANPLNATGLFDAFLVSLDSMGQHRWTKHITGSGEELAFDVITTIDGGVAIAGSFKNELTIDGTMLSAPSPESSAWVAAFDAAGTSTWIKPLSNSDGQAVTGICRATDGSIIATGTFSGAFPDSLLTSEGDDDVFVAKLDPTAMGNVLDIFKLGNAAPQQSRRIGCLPDGGLALTGHFAATAGDDDLGIGPPVDSVGLTDVFAVIVEADGTLRQRVFAGGSAFDDRLQGLAVDPAGNIVIAGFVQEEVELGGVKVQADGFGGVLVGKFTALGEPLWVRGYDGASADGADTVAVDDSGLVWLGGYFAGTIDFTPSENTTPITLTAQGLPDGFVVRLSP